MVPIDTLPSVRLRWQGAGYAREDSPFSTVVRTAEDREDEPERWEGDFRLTCGFAKRTASSPSA